MTILDLLVLLSIATACFGGYRAGFIAKATSWVGLTVGVALAFGIIPVVVGLLDSADDAWILLTALAVLVAAAAGGHVLGIMAGERLRIAMPERVETSDRVAGSVVGGLGVLILFWLLIPTLAAVPGWPADQVDASLLARTVAERLPEPPDTLEVLRKAVGADTFPAGFAEAPVIGDPGPPPSNHDLTPRVEMLVSQSVVKIWAESCGRFQEGTGHVLGPHLVVTNAHVVAGGNAFRVTDDDGVGHGARLVAYDAVRDLAVLFVEDLDRQALFSRSAVADEVVAVFGHPGGSSLRIAPARVSELVRARGRDLYDTIDTVRDVIVVAASLELGDSGAPLINAAGEVVGVVFAVAPDSSSVAYAVTIDEVKALTGSLRNNLNPPSVDAQACLG